MNKEQREGIARVLDAFAVATTITYATGITGRLHLDLWEQVTLLSITSCFLTLSFLIRGDI